MMDNSEKNNKMKRTDDGSIRLNKWISDAGICSRREADRLIEAGRVTVDDQPVSMGTRVRKGQKVCVDGQPVSREKQVILLAVNKPVGVVCTTEKKWGDKTLEELVNYPKRVFSVGRLDKDSEGLILMTNQGDLLNKIMKAGNYHEKEYVVTVDKKVTPDFIRRMAKGVPLKELDTVTRPCRVEMAGENRFRIVLTQGLNRQIRRMCEYFGYHVVRLVRVRIMNIELGRLPSGQYRHLTKTEAAVLMDSLKKSENNTEFRYLQEDSGEESRSKKPGSGSQNRSERPGTGSQNRSERPGSGNQSRSEKPRNGSQSRSGGEHAKRETGRKNPGDRSRGRNRTGKQRMGR